MKYYAGLDVSLKTTAVCIVDHEGTVLKEGMVNSDPQAIATFLADTGLAFERVGLEVGSLAPWLYHGLAAAALPVSCLETRHAKAALKAQTVKTDRNDARGLAHILRTGWFKTVHIKSEASQKLRVLLNNRSCLVDKRVDISNQIRGTLKVFGLKVGNISKAAYESRIRELLTGDAELTAFILPLLAARRVLVEQERHLDKTIRTHIKADPVCGRLMSIPGVGPLTALAFKSTIDQPQRFRKSRDVGSHVGLTPRKYASGEVNFNGRITKCGDALLRTHLYEAAQMLLTRVAKWSKLKAWGVKLAQRSSFKNACVAVARKLAVIMHRIWLDGTTFQWGQESQPLTTAG